MDGKELTSLLTKYKEGTCTSEEKALLENWVASVTYPEYQITEEELGYDLNEISDTLPLVRRQNRLWPRIAVAAAAVVTIAFGAWFFSVSHSANSEDTVNQILSGSADIAAGKNTATLTLANGKTIVLSDAKAGVTVGKELTYNDGSVVENSASHSGSSSGAKNMLTASTPRGGTYQVILPDGTRIWMNADSKISFPSEFSGNERMVILQGEAYFEVAKVFRTSKKKRGSKIIETKERMPFIVKMINQEVEVLGTHFNIKAYKDEENVKTTLLEGSVRVNSSSVLVPGEQAISNGDVIKIEKADLQEAMAWKNGSIMFRDKDLEGIMQELSRWYDVTVVYAPNAPKHDTFSGAVSRTRNISAVLERIQTTGSVKFKVEDRVVTVSQ